MINPKRYSRLSAGDRTVLIAIPDFPQFPKLPTEIRRKIFKYAILAQNQTPSVLQINAKTVICDPDIGLYASFESLRGLHKRFEGYQNFFLDARGKGLLSACQESRSIYEATFKDSFPAQSEYDMTYTGIHFDDEALLYIAFFGADCCKWKSYRRSDV
jgi:hypothetical protein